MKYSFLSLFLFVFISFVSAQKDSITNEILSTQSKTELIDKGRQLLLDKINTGDKVRSLAIFNYLKSEVADDYYNAFILDEKWLLDFWLGEYQSLLLEVQNIEKVGAANKTKIYPRKDALLTAIKNQVFVVDTDIRLQITNSDKSAEEKAFLILLFRWVCFANGQSALNREIINQEAQAFLNNYPSSIYNNFTRKHILYELSTSNWKLEGDIFGGYACLSNMLKKNFNNVGTFGFTLGLGYKKWELLLRDELGFSRTKMPITLNQVTWAKKSAVQFVNGEIGLGYTVIENKRLKITPFAGVGFISFSPTGADVQKNPTYENLDFTASPSYNAGVNFDLKLWDKTRSSYAGLFSENAFVRFRLEYCYTQFIQKYPNVAGNLIQFSLGLGGISSRVKRKK